MTKSKPWWVGSLFAAVLLVVAPAWPQDGKKAAPTAAGPVVDAGARADGGGSGDAALDAEARDEDRERMLESVKRVDALIAGTLDVAIDPATLFGVALTDERAVLIEVQRLERIVQRGGLDGGAAADAEAKPVPAGKKPVPKGTEKVQDAAADAPAEVAEPEPALWEAQLELDNARLRFLRLPQAERARLLQVHETRQAEAAKADAERAISEAEQKAEAASKARREAAEAVQRARSEAARIVAEERVRLLGVKEQQAQFEAELARREQALSSRSEVALTWRRRVAELVEARKTKEAKPEQADAVYAELISLLRNEARRDLSAALTELSSGESSVPSPGPDNLDTAGAQIDRTEVDAVRAELVTQEAALTQRDEVLRRKLAAILIEQVESLNRDRLALYPHLSSARRSQLTDFGPEGINQAKAEINQVALVVRYHAVAGAQWLFDIKDGKSTGVSGFIATLSLIKILAVLVAFVAWRRRADRLIGSWRGKLAEAAKTSRSPLVGWTARALELLPRIRRPLEWLLVVWLSLWIAGPNLAGLLEVRIPWIILSWTLGGVLVVNAIDAIAASRATALSGRTDTAALRLRSLRLLGRVIVAVGLTLALSAEIVGKGTIYAWVLGTCWLAALPIGLVFVRWWREVIFERLALRKKKSPFAQQVLTRQEGWTSFPAAAVGGAYLIGYGIVRIARSYVTGLNVTRRALAFWFRREVSKQAKDRTEDETLKPLGGAIHQKLDPEATAEEIVSTKADRDLEEVIDCIDAPGGGVFAVVGERGAGKTTLLQRIVRKHSSVVLVRCPAGGLPELTLALRRALGLPDDADDATVKAHINANTKDNAILIDDAQRLVRPVIGGFDDLDAILSFAREACQTCTWVFAVGSVTWRLIERARDARPVFDDVIRLSPWSEENIATLLQSLSSQVGIKPSFEGLVTETPEDDEVERKAQLARAEASYYRLLWDYSEGNPAVASHFWRESLRIDPDGNVRVQLFNPPPTRDLESLPDPAVFVLRAVVQLELASLDDLQAATIRSRNQVADAVRYGLHRGYLETIGDRYRLSWAWFRAITNFLQRRHLLAAPGK